MKAKDFNSPTVGTRGTRRVGSEEAYRADWLLVARRRAEELYDGSVEPLHASEVMQRARALIK